MRLGPILRRWRITSELGIREFATMIGIPPGALSRFENSNEISSRNLVKILAWVMQPTAMAALSTESILEEHDDQLTFSEASIT